MSKRYTVEFNAKITPVKPLNDEFTLCKCYTMALEKNRNLSYISKDAADAALPTLYNIPVIGHIKVDNDGNYHMGGHDMTLESDANGNLMFKSLCVPYGVVPQQDNVHYEDIQEPNGDVKTYLVSDVILWTGRFPELNEAVFDDKIYFGQSMEINVNDYAPLEEDKNYTNILSYTYSALCLLGKSDNPECHVEPCFPMARVEPYEFSLDDDKFSELMSQLKDELAHCFEANSEKGGENMDETNTIVEPVEVSIETPVEEVAETTEQTEMFECSQEEFTNVENDSSEDAAISFASTYKEKREAIANALPFVQDTDENGNVVHFIDYWLCDFDDSYAYVEKTEWSKDSGHDETKGRFAYAVSEDNEVALTGEFEQMFVKWLTQDEIDQIELMRGQYEELTAYKNNREAEDRNAEYDAVIAEFDDLAGNDEFESICENKYSYESAESLKNACYIVRGKFSARVSKPKTTSEPTIPVAQPSTTEVSLRERFHAKYGKNN